MRRGLAVGNNVEVLVEVGNLEHLGLRNVAHFSQGGDVSEVDAPSCVLHAVQRLDLAIAHSPDPCGQINPFRDNSKVW